eukprot:356524-Chlamydomonas_euryale.AAC.2
MQGGEGAGIAELNYLGGRVQLLGRRVCMAARLGKHERRAPPRFLNLSPAIAHALPVAVALSDRSCR